MSVASKEAIEAANVLFAQAAEDLFALPAGYVPKPSAPLPPDVPHGLAIGDRVRCYWAPDNDGHTVEMLGTVVAIDGPMSRDHVEVRLDPIVTTGAARDCTKVTP